jgi:hypothetical protein
MVKRPCGLAFAGLCSCAALLASVTSCNIVGPAAYFIDGPPTVPAEFVLPDVPTVIFIDDRQNVVNPVSLRRVIADQCSQDLMVKKQLTTTISSQDAMSLASVNDRNSKVMSLEEIGLAVGAKQVIAVEMIQFTESPDGGATLAPSAACRVKVLDVENRQRIYPLPDTMMPARSLVINLPPVDPALLRTRTGRLQIFEALSHETGSRIAKLFYEHEPRELGGGLAPKPKQ